jgi:plastocyanin
MKTTFTTRTLLMPVKVMALTCLLYSPAEAQISHVIDVVNFSFDPEELTIQAGDTVIWTNTEGSHNVDGTQGEFPSNPESFGNEVGTEWTYTFVFTIPGTYDYVCDPHKYYGMTGKIIVEDAVPASDRLQVTPMDGELRIFPNPTQDFIRLEAGGEIESVSVYTITGKPVVSDSRENKGSLQISMGDAAPGIYLVRVRMAGDGSESVSRIVKR